MQASPLILRLRAMACHPNGSEIYLKIALVAKFRPSSISGRDYHERDFSLHVDVLSN